MSLISQKKKGFSFTFKASLPAFISFVLVPKVIFPFLARVHIVIVINVGCKGNAICQISSARRENKMPANANFLLSAPAGILSYGESC